MESQRFICLHIIKNDDISMTPDRARALYDIVVDAANRDSKHPRRAPEFDDTAKLVEGAHVLTSGEIQAAKAAVEFRNMRNAPRKKFKFW